MNSLGFPDKVDPWEVRAEAQTIHRRTDHHDIEVLRARRAAGRNHAREGGAEGCPGPKVVKPAVRKTVVCGLVERGLVSKRCGSRLLNVSRSVVR